MRRIFTSTGQRFTPPGDVSDWIPFPGGWCDTPKLRWLKWVQFRGDRYLMAVGIFEVGDGTFSSAIRCHDQNQKTPPIYHPVTEWLSWSVHQNLDLAKEYGNLFRGDPLLDAMVTAQFREEVSHEQ